MRMVIVQGERDMAEGLVHFVRELGHEPRVVRSAEAALAAFSTHRPQAMIVDLDLPGIQGAEFLQLVPVRRAAVPVLVVAGPRHEAEARQCLRLGALDVFTRPIARGRLAEVLAYLELGLLGASSHGEAVERRENRRASVIAPVTVFSYDGTEHSTTTINISAGGVKVRSTRALDDAAVKLSIAPADRSPAIEILAAPVRRDPDGVVFVFLSPQVAQTERLVARVDRLLAA